MKQKSESCSVKNVPRSLRNARQNRFVFKLTHVCIGGSEPAVVSATALVTSGQSYDWTEVSHCSHSLDDLHFQGVQVVCCQVNAEQTIEHLL